MKKYNLLLLVSHVTLFTGCSSYNLDVAHNKEQKITQISIADKTYQLLNSSILREDQNAVGFKTLSLSSEDSYCKQIQYRESANLTSKNKFFIYSSKEDIYLNNRNQCTTERIQHIDFHDCDNSSTITKDINGQHGIVQKKYLRLQDKECFYKLRDLVKGKNIVYEQKKYKGTFTAEVNIDKCGTGGNLNVQVNPNNKIVGTASYHYKGKKASTKLWGKVKGKEFHGETRNMKFYGEKREDSNIIKGEYFNRICKGTFILEITTDRTVVKDDDISEHRKIIKKINNIIKRKVPTFKSIKLNNQLKTYLDKDNKKAFAMAIDKDGQYRYGNSWGYNTQKKAVDRALEECNKKEIKASCIVYMEGNKILIK